MKLFAAHAPVGTTQNSGISNFELRSNAKLHFAPQVQNEAFCGACTGWDDAK
jgi:hypothetical protein